jgi:hypothetical protein
MAYRICNFRLQIYVEDNRISTEQLATLRKLFSEVKLQDTLESLIQTTVTKAVITAEGLDPDSVREVKLDIYLTKE